MKSSGHAGRTPALGPVFAEDSELLSFRPI